MIKKFLGFAVVLCCLQGCSSLAPESYQEPRLTFDHIVDPLHVDVKSTVVVNQYHSPLINGHMEHRFVNDPVLTLTHLINKRIKTVGDSGGLSFKVLDASLIEKKIDIDDSFFSLFNIQNSKEYEGTLVVLMERINDRNEPLIGHKITVKRRTTIPHNASMIEREKAGFKMLESLMADFDIKMTELLHQYYL